jgi:hypothetical protein
MSATQRQWVRYACRVFSTHEEERIWLEMCRGVPTISYLRNHELMMLYDIIMRG